MTRGGEPGVGPLLDGAPCGFVSFADDGTILRVNRTLLDMLGRQRDELVGESLEGILGLGSRIFYHTHLFPLVRLHGRADEIYVTLRSGSGDDLGVLLYAARRDEGPPVTDCVVVRVREREKFEAELLRARKEADRLRVEAEDANQAKSRFLAVMSHELRTPLNAIAGYAQLIELGVHGPVTDAQQDSLRRIVRSQRHLLRLINDVLNLSRLEAGGVTYRVEDVDLAAVVDEVVPLVEPQAAAAGLVLMTEVPAGLVARADGDKVQQVVLNLLGNAVKFTRTGGRIEVGAMRASPTGPMEEGAAADAGATPASAASDPVAVWVRDTGVGIPAERLDGIFQAFVRVEDGTGPTPEGTGLGLSISRDLARGMGGDLEVESVVGEGSTFTLTLPGAGREEANG